MSVPLSVELLGLMTFPSVFKPGHTTPQVFKADWRLCKFQYLGYERW